MKVLVLGNILVKEDSLPLRILPKLKKEFPKIEFKEIDAVEELQNEGRNLLILDTAEIIKDTRIIGLKDIKTEKIYSMHDFDLGYTLLLLKKMNLIDDAKVICVPMNIDEKNAFSQVQFILKKCVAQDMQGS